MSAIFDSIREIVARSRARITGGLDDSDAIHPLAGAVLDELYQAGFADVAVPESLGGGGGGFDDLAEVVGGLASEGVFVPVAQINIGALILAEGGVGSLSMPAMYASEQFIRKSTSSGSLTVVSLPWADHAASLVVPTGEPNQFIQIEGNADRLHSVSDYGLAPSFSGELQPLGSSQHVVEVENAEKYVNEYTLLLLAEAKQLISTIHGISVEYAKQREQFGHAIAGFPAVQDLLVSSAQATAVSDSASARARVAWFDYRSSNEIAAATWLVANSAKSAIRAAHQVHGAIGMTDEYRLSRFTRRLHQLRNEIYADWCRRAPRYSARLVEDGFLAGFLDAPV